MVRVHTGASSADCAGALLVPVTINKATTTHCVADLIPALLFASIIIFPRSFLAVLALGRHQTSEAFDVENLTRPASAQKNPPRKTNLSSPYVCHGLLYSLDTL